MVIKKLDSYRFKDSVGVFVVKGYGLYAEGKGFVTFDNQTPYTPRGGRKALQSILDAGGFTEEPNYIKPIN